MTIVETWRWPSMVRWKQDKYRVGPVVYNWLLFLSSASDLNLF